MMDIKLTDTMAQIQKKLNKGGNICFQYGIYNITKQLVIKAGTFITLNGSTLRRSADIQSIFINDCTAKTKGYKGAGKITILNGTFEGMGKYAPDNLLTFFHSHDIHIEGVTFLDNRCHAIELNATKDVEIIRSKFLGCNTAQPYQEAIQIDAAYAKGFFKAGSTVNSKCYDGTVCSNINIENCTFDKSNFRKRPSACIGTHTQILGGARHTGIKIFNNTFNCDELGNCLSFIGMEDVQVLSNYFKHCGRIARIYNKEYSYDLKGNQVKPQNSDGVCKDILFYDNLEQYAGEENKCVGIYAISVSDPHEDIQVVSNQFIKSNDYEKYYLYTEHCKDVIDEKNRTQLKSRINP